MPAYTYVCTECLYTGEVSKKMSEHDRIEKCPKCEHEMGRDFKTDLPHASADRYSKVIVSDALAMNPEQIPAHKKQFPNIDVTPQGQPVFDNFKQHDAYLNKCNFKKVPKKKRLRGTKIETKKKPTPSV
jgi:putative FmdB family regulatory protein